MATFEDLEEHIFDYPDPDEQVESEYPVGSAFVPEGSHMEPTIGQIWPR